MNLRSSHQTRLEKIEGQTLTGNTPLFAFIELNDNGELEVTEVWQRPAQQVEHIKQKISSVESYCETSTAKVVMNLILPI